MNTYIIPTDKLANDYLSALKADEILARLQHALETDDLEEVKRILADENI